MKTKVFVTTTMRIAGRMELRLLRSYDSTDPSIQESGPGTSGRSTTTGASWTDGFGLKVKDADEQGPEWKVWEASVATSSAPTLFPPFIRKDGRVFIDGGLHAHNPAYLAVTEALDIFKDSGRDIDCIVSMGCGFSPELTGEGSSVFFWLGHVVNLTFDAAVHDAKVRTLISRFLPRTKYIRLEPPIGNIEFYESRWRVLQSMRRDCMRYIRQLHSEFGEVANLLKRRARPVDENQASSTPSPTPPAATVQSVTPPSPSGHAATDSASTSLAASASAPAAASSGNHRKDGAKKLPPRSALAFEDVTIPGATTPMITKSADSKSGDLLDHAANVSPASADHGPPRDEAVSEEGGQTLAKRPQAAEDEASLPEGGAGSFPRETPAAAIDPSDDAAMPNPSTKGDIGFSGAAVEATGTPTIAPSTAPSQNAAAVPAFGVAATYLPAVDLRTSWEMYKEGVISKQQLEAVCDMLGMPGFNSTLISKDSNTEKTNDEILRQPGNGSVDSQTIGNGVQTT